MAFGDCSSYAVEQLQMGDTKAERISCCSCVFSIIFFFVFFVAALISGAELGAEGNMAVTLTVNGTVGAEHHAVVTYPQLTFCPMWESGVIDAIECYQSDNTKKGGFKTVPMTWKPMMQGSRPKHPEWGCSAYNYNGKQITDGRTNVFCKINSTNTATIDGMKLSWPGRVRAYIDTPGTNHFEHCENCLDGIDGGILIGNYTTFLFWQAHTIKVEGDTKIEYRASGTRLPRPEVFDKLVHSDIEAILGFYSQDVWQYRTAGDFASEIAGEAVGGFCSFIGGLIFFAVAMHYFLKTTLILCLVGREGLAQAGEREKFSLLP